MLRTIKINHNRTRNNTRKFLNNKINLNNSDLVKSYLKIGNTETKSGGGKDKGEKKGKDLNLKIENFNKSFPNVDSNLLNPKINKNDFNGFGDNNTINNLKSKLTKDNNNIIPLRVGKSLIKIFEEWVNGQDKEIKNNKDILRKLFVLVINRHINFLKDKCNELDSCIEFCKEWLEFQNTKSEDVVFIPKDLDDMINIASKSIHNEKELFIFFQSYLDEKSILSHYGLFNNKHYKPTENNIDNNIDKIKINKFNESNNKIEPKDIDDELKDSFKKIFLNNTYWYKFFYLISLFLEVKILSENTDFFVGDMVYYKSQEVVGIIININKDKDYEIVTNPFKFSLISIIKNFIVSARCRDTTQDMNFIITELRENIIQQIEIERNINNICSSNNIDNKYLSNIHTVSKKDLCLQTNLMPEEYQERQIIYCSKNNKCYTVISVVNKIYSFDENENDDSIYGIVVREIKKSKQWDSLNKYNVFNDWLAISCQDIDINSNDFLITFPNKNSTSNNYEILIDSNGNIRSPLLNDSNGKRRLSDLILLINNGLNNGINSFDLSFINSFTSLYFNNSRSVDEPFEIKFYKNKYLNNNCLIKQFHSQELNLVHFISNYNVINTSQNLVFELKNYRNHMFLSDFYTEIKKISIEIKKRIVISDLKNKKERVLVDCINTLNLLGDHLKGDINSLNYFLKIRMWDQNRLKLIIEKAKNIFKYDFNNINSKCSNKNVEDELYKSNDSQLFTNNIVIDRLNLSNNYNYIEYDEIKKSSWIDDIFTFSNNIEFIKIINNLTLGINRKKNNENKENIDFFYLDPSSKNREKLNIDSNLDIFNIFYVDGKMSNLSKNIYLDKNTLNKVSYEKLFEEISKKLLDFNKLCKFFLEANNDFRLCYDNYKKLKERYNDNKLLKSINVSLNNIFFYDLNLSGSLCLLIYNEKNKNSNEILDTKTIRYIINNNLFENGLSKDLKLNYEINYLYNLRLISDRLNLTNNFGKYYIDCQVDYINPFNPEDSTQVSITKNMNNNVLYFTYGFKKIMNIYSELFEDYLGLGNMSFNNINNQNFPGFLDILINMILHKDNCIYFQVPLVNFSNEEYSKKEIYNYLPKKYIDFYKVFEYYIDTKKDIDIKLNLRRISIIILLKNIINEDLYLSLHTMPDLISFLSNNINNSLDFSNLLVEIKKKILKFYRDNGINTNIILETPSKNYNENYEDYEDYIIIMNNSYITNFNLGYKNDIERFNFYKYYIREINNENNKLDVDNNDNNDNPLNKDSNSLLEINYKNNKEIYYDYHFGNLGLKFNFMKFLENWKNSITNYSRNIMTNKPNNFVLNNILNNITSNYKNIYNIELIRRFLLRKYDDIISFNISDDFISNEMDYIEIDKKKIKIVIFIFFPFLLNLFYVIKNKLNIKNITLDDIYLNDNFKEIYNITFKNINNFFDKDISLVNNILEDIWSFINRQILNNNIKDLFNLIERYIIFLLSKALNKGKTSEDNLKDFNQAINNIPFHFDENIGDVNLFTKLLYKENKIKNNEIIDNNYYNCLNTIISKLGNLNSKLVPIFINGISILNNNKINKIVNHKLVSLEICNLIWQNYRFSNFSNKNDNLQNPLITHLIKNRKEVFLEYLNDNENNFDELNSLEKGYLTVKDSNSNTDYISIRLCYDSIKEERNKKYYTNLSSLDDIKFFKNLNNNISEFEDLTVNDILKSDTDKLYKILHSNNKKYNKVYYQNDIFGLYNSHKISKEVYDIIMGNINDKNLGSTKEDILLNDLVEELLYQTNLTNVLNSEFDLNDESFREAIKNFIKQKNLIKDKKLSNDQKKLIKDYILKHPNINELRKFCEQVEKDKNDKVLEDSNYKERDLLKDYSKLDSINQFSLTLINIYRFFEKNENCVNFLKGSVDSLVQIYVEHKSLFHLFLKAYSQIEINNKEFNKYIFEIAIEYNQNLKNPNVLDKKVNQFKNYLSEVFNRTHYQLFFEKYYLNRGIYRCIRSYKQYLKTEDSRGNIMDIPFIAYILKINVFVLRSTKLNILVPIENLYFDINWPTIIIIELGELNENKDNQFYEILGFYENKRYLGNNLLKYYQNDVLKTDGNIKIIFDNYIVDRNLGNSKYSPILLHLLSNYIKNNYILFPNSKVYFPKEKDLSYLLTIQRKNIDFNQKIFISDPDNKEILFISCLINDKMDLNLKNNDEILIIDNENIIKRGKFVSEGSTFDYFINMTESLKIKMNNSNKIEKIPIKYCWKKHSIIMTRTNSNGLYTYKDLFNDFLRDIEEKQNNEDRINEMKFLINNDFFLKNSLNIYNQEFRDDNNLLFQNWNFVLDTGRTDIFDELVTSGYLNQIRVDIFYKFRSNCLFQNVNNNHQIGLLISDSPYKNSNSLEVVNHNLDNRNLLKPLKLSGFEKSNVLSSESILFRINSKSNPWLNNNLALHKNINDSLYYYENNNLSPIINPDENRILEIDFYKENRFTPDKKKLLTDTIYQNSIRKNKKLIKIGKNIILDNKLYDPVLVRVELDQNGELITKKKNLTNEFFCSLIEPIKYEIPISFISDTLTYKELIEIEKIIYPNNFNNSPKIQEPQINNIVNQKDRLINLLNFLPRYDEYFNNLLNNLEDYRKISDNFLLFLLFPTDDKFQERFPQSGFKLINSYDDISLTNLNSVNFIRLAEENHYPANCWKKWIEIINYNVENNIYDLKDLLTKEVRERFFQYIKFFWVYWNNIKNSYKLNEDIYKWFFTFLNIIQKEHKKSNYNINKQKKSINDSLFIFSPDERDYLHTFMGEIRDKETNLPLGTYLLIDKHKDVNIIENYNLRFYSSKYQDEIHPKINEIIVKYFYNSPDGLSKAIEIQKIINYIEFKNIILYKNKDFINSIPIYRLIEILDIFGTFENFYQKTVNNK